MSQTLSETSTKILFWYPKDLPSTKWYTTYLMWCLGSFIVMTVIQKHKQTANIQWNSVEALPPSDQRCCCRFCWTISQSVRPPFCECAVYLDSSIILLSSLQHEKWAVWKASVWLVTGFWRLRQASLSIAQLCAMMINLLWRSCIHLFLFWPFGVCVCLFVCVCSSMLQYVYLFRWISRYLW